MRGGQPSIELSIVETDRKSISNFKFEGEVDERGRRQQGAGVSTNLE